jgi:hypothetical protein
VQEPNGLDSLSLGSAPCPVASYAAARVLQGGVGGVSVPLRAHMCACVCACDACVCARSSGVTMLAQRRNLCNNVRTSRRVSLYLSGHVCVCVCVMVGGCASVL